jgi:hypothetical protein
MKTIKSKRLNKTLNTICDFKAPYQKNSFGDTDHPTGTDPTNTTVITLTTISSQLMNNLK